MREDAAKLAQEIRDASSRGTLGDRVMRLARQEYAKGSLDAYREEKSPTLEALADDLEYNLADMLQQYFDDGKLEPNGPVSGNRDTLKLIARHAAMKFQKLNA